MTDTVARDAPRTRTGLPEHWVVFSIAAAAVFLMSFDSTLKSNLSVGLPLDLLFLEQDALRVGLNRRIGQDDPYYRTISDGWSNALKIAFSNLPDFPG